MTNREWLNSLSNEDFVEWLFGADAFDIKETNDKTYDVKVIGLYPHFQNMIGNTIDAKLTISLWLEEERVKINDTTTNN